MKRALLVLILAALAGSARAGTIAPPAGWSSDAKAAVSLTQQLGAVTHFGGLQSIVTTEVYRAPNGSLFVTRVIANARAEERNRAATAELAEVDAGMLRAGGNVAAEAGDAKADEPAKQLVASRTWLDTSTKVRTSSAIIVAGDAQKLVAVIGECVFGPDASAEVIGACKAALGTLDPEIAAAARVPLQLDAAALDQARKRAAPAPAPKTGPSLVESGDRPSLPPMQIPQEPREPDRRPIYVGLGLIVLAVIFYFNRKNREKLERDYEERTADKSAPSRDGDADDLHAAAADDGTKKDQS